MFLNLKNGGFSMPPHIFLTRDTTLAQIQAAFPDRETHDVGTGWYWFALPETEYRGRRFLISLAFCGQTLKSIRFAMADRNAASWDGWSEAYELESLSLYRRWLVEEIGSTGKFDWGGCGAHYDQKSGICEMFVCYV